MTNQGKAIMQSIIVITALHVLSSVFWAGSTFTLAHAGGVRAERLFRPQIGAAIVAVITGAALWHYLHEGSFGISEQILATGAACAIIAAGIQVISTGSTLRRAGPVNSAQALRSIAIGQRAAAVLLAITIICMSVARYVLTVLAGKQRSAWQQCTSNRPARCSCINLTTGAQPTLEAICRNIQSIPI